MNNIVVQKFGGTSVATPERIRGAAARVAATLARGEKPVVVVSAMAGVTNQLVDYVAGFINDFQNPEYDAVVASGEQVTAGLMALALSQQGYAARSFCGWQLPFVTNGTHSKARIERIETTRLTDALKDNVIPVVAGFQGVAFLEGEGRITTLGRGGSDTSAVALAAALKAKRCDIFTDVDGVYTTDPRIVPKARKISVISYEEMLEMASQGAKVLQTRSVELAMKYNVPVQVLSSFDDIPGTLVVDENNMMEHQLVSGIALSRDEAKITLRRVPDRPGVSAAIFGPLAAAAINVDMIVQVVSADNSTTDMTFTVAKADLNAAMEALSPIQPKLGFAGFQADPNIAKISVIGVGMRSHAGVAQVMFQTLSDKGINIQAIATSEIKISVLIADEYAELAVRALHAAYGLDEAEK